MSVPVETVIKSSTYWSTQYSTTYKNCLLLFSLVLVQLSHNLSLTVTQNVQTVTTLTCRHSQLPYIVGFWFTYNSTNWYYTRLTEVTTNGRTTRINPERIPTPDGSRLTLAFHFRSYR